MCRCVGNGNGFIAAWPCNMYKLIAGKKRRGTNNRHNYGGNLKRSLTASGLRKVDCGQQTVDTGILQWLLGLGRNYFSTGRTHHVPLPAIVVFACQRPGPKIKAQIEIPIGCSPLGIWPFYGFFGCFLFAFCCPSRQSLFLFIETTEQQ